jgi:hypothetical protein
MERLRGDLQRLPTTSLKRKEIHSSLMGFNELPQIDRSRIQSSDSALALESVFRLPDFVTRAQSTDLGKDYEIELA